MRPSSVTSRAREEIGALARRAGAHRARLLPRGAATATSTDERLAGTRRCASATVARRRDEAIARFYLAQVAEWTGDYRRAIALERAGHRRRPPPPARAPRRLAGLVSRQGRLLPGDYGARAGPPRPRPTRSATGSAIASGRAACSTRSAGATRRSAITTARASTTQRAAALAPGGRRSRDRRATPRSISPSTTSRSVASTRRAATSSRSRTGWRGPAIRGCAGATRCTRSTPAPSSSWHGGRRRSRWTGPSRSSRPRSSTARRSSRRARSPPRGRALLALGRRDESRDRLERALQVAERIGSPRNAWRARGALGELYHRTGDEAAARLQEHARREILEAAARSLEDDAVRRQLLAAATSEHKADAAL